MTGQKVFVDTNVFAYALDLRDQKKRDQAIQLIEDRRDEIIVSTQVLIELYAVCTRKLGMDLSDARRAVQSVAGFPVVDTDRGLVLTAVSLSASARISIFDAAIVCAAQRAECGVLLTEDLNPNQRFADVVVQNPFA